MKKLGFLFIAALISQGAFADKIAAKYADMTVVITETGTSLTWAPDAVEKRISAQQAILLYGKAKEDFDKMNLELDQLIAGLVQGNLNR